jgi:hypothetical protein
VPRFGIKPGSDIECRSDIGKASGIFIDIPAHVDSWRLWITIAIFTGPESPNRDVQCHRWP